MTYIPHINAKENVAATISIFKGEGGTAEISVLFQILPDGRLFNEQLESLHRTYTEMLSTHIPSKATAVFKRYFLSDAANQTPLLEAMLKRFPSCPTSIIQQAPLNGSKIALWAYWIEGATLDNNHPAHNGYTHIWSGGNTLTTGNAEEQMRTHLIHYDEVLLQEGLTLAEDCVRTWIFVQNIDVNYSGVVKGRRDRFEKIGLTPSTHYIASTGIEGRVADPHALVTFDAYTVKGIKPEQKQYLYALTHLNPTYQYGVTFERGTAIEYGDRKHLFISGTASINNKGEVVHTGDVISQTRRMWQNIEALLAEGHACFADIAMSIVYLRDIADYAAVRDLFKSEHPQLPCIFVLAPVCRPTWLIEMECIAITPNHNPQYNIF